MTLHRVRNGDVTLAVVDEGPTNGPPVVLLHGFPDTHEIWSSQIAAMAGAGHRVIAPDTRGCGASDRPTAVGRYRLDELIGDVVAICGSLGLRRTALVAHDLGAVVGWLLAAHVPALVERYAALAVGYPAGFRGLPLEQLQRFWYLPLFASEEAEQFLADENWWGLRLLAADHPDIDGVIERFTDGEAMTAALAWYRANISTRHFVTFDTTAQHLSCPVLTLRGANDSVNGAEQLNRSQSFVDGAWASATISDGGHWLQADRAAPEVAQHLIRFLGEARQ